MSPHFTYQETEAKVSENEYRVYKNPSRVSETCKLPNFQSLHIFFYLVIASTYSTLELTHSKPAQVGAIVNKQVSLHWPERTRWICPRIAAEEIEA